MAESMMLVCAHVFMQRLHISELQVLNTFDCDTRQLWTKNCSLDMQEVCGLSLLDSHRKLQWMLKHIMWLAPTGSARKKDAAFQLCRVRNLCSVTDRECINEQDAVTGESALMSLCADGGNIDDIELLVASGADLNIKSSSGKLAVDMASEHGHDRCVRSRLSCHRCSRAVRVAGLCTRCTVCGAMRTPQAANQST
jgi:hypothetical protein